MCHISTVKDKMSRHNIILLIKIDFLKEICQLNLSFEKFILLLYNLTFIILITPWNQLGVCVFFFN